MHSFYAAENFGEESVCSKGSVCLQYDSRHHHHARPLWFDPESGGELLSLYGLQCLGT